MKKFRRTLKKEYVLLIDQKTKQVLIVKKEKSNTWHLIEIKNFTLSRIETYNSLVNLQEDDFEYLIYNAYVDMQQVNEILKQIGKMEYKWVDKEEIFGYKLKTKFFSILAIQICEKLRWFEEGVY